MAETELDLAAAKLGDAAAFSRMVLRHSRRLSLAIHMILREQSRVMLDPDDILQVVVGRAWSSLDRFETRGPSSFYAWLLALARNEIRNQTKAERRRLHLLPDSGEPAADDLVGSITSPSMAADRKAAVDRMLRGMETLSAEDRQLISWHWLEERSFNEIASLQGGSKTDAWRRVRDAMGRLRLAVEEDRLP